MESPLNVASQVNRELEQFLLAVLVLFLAVAVILVVIVVVKKRKEAVVSKFGRCGYLKPIYNEWVRNSQYVTVRDKTKLAVDIFRPAQNGKVVSEALPVIWTHDRYRRLSVGGVSGLKAWLGQMPWLQIVLKQSVMSKTRLDRFPWLQTVIRQGYVIAVVDVRGGGNSYGTQQGPFTQDETWDAYDIIEWFAAQPWSNGSIGMFGRSYLGITQYMAASTAPPHLKAIFPEMAMFDLYALIYPGGVFRDDFVANWSRLVKDLDMAMPAALIDQESDGKILAEAIEEHKANRDVFEMFAPLHYRDSIDEESKDMLYITRSPSNYVSEVKKSGVAVYHLAGWYDLWSRDALVWFNNLDNPQRIVIGPWSHTNNAGFDLAAEHLRWYDYWLKGIDNGIMDEAPIHYYTLGAPKGKEWRTAWQWPLANEKLTRYYFHNEASGSLNSANQGLLSPHPPKSAIGQDDYTVDYMTTSGTATRWANGYGGGFGYPDMTLNDHKGLTYTTTPLASDVEVTGHPVIHLWVTSTAKDVDFFAYLEEIDNDESHYSHYITEGTLRASHRATATPPFNYIGLPYHRSFAEDLADLPSEPIKLIFDLHPTSNIFAAGHRIRVTITNTDKDNALTPELSPPPLVSIYCNSNYASYITLPIIPKN